MDTYYGSSDAHGGGDVGIGAARHVYGPASVHLLPCTIHHTAGPAPVATYFRPRSPLTENEQGNSGRNNNGNSIDVGDGTASATATAAQTEATNSNGLGDGLSKGTDAGRDGGGRRMVQRENDELVALGGQGGDIGFADQDWELFDDDNAERTARFRGRKLAGRKVQLPEGVYGVLLREQPCPEGVREDNDDLASYWAAETCFQDVTVWGHDQPRRESTLDRSLAWLEVSKSV
ncbi:unnamed protein product, partial [Hapterophycus canaliculatus]